MTITTGTKFQVDTEQGFVDVCNLTATTAICFYSSVNDAVMAKHLTLSGTTITAGSKLTIDSTAQSTGYIRSTRLSDTSALVVYFYGTTHRARVITVSGTTLTANAIANLTDTTNINFNSVATLSSTACIYVYSDSGTNNGKARVLSISGTTVTENAAFTYDANTYNGAVTALSSTVAVVVFADASNSNLLTGEVLDISGTTITGNADQTLSTAVADTTVFHRIAIDALDSSTIIVSWFISSTYRAVAASRSGGSLTNGLTVILTAANAGTNVGITAMSATKAVAVEPAAAGQQIGIHELSISGTAITADDFQSVSTGTGCTDSGVAGLDSLNTIAVWRQFSETGAVSATTSPVAGGALTLSAMNKPVDVELDGSNLYIAFLQGGNPILTRFSTALDSDATSIFNPGMGSDIGVQCGDFDTDVIYIGGDLGGTNVLEKSTDGGSSFSVVDPATFGAISSFEVGPDSDNRVILLDDVNNDIQETLNSGTAWIQRNSNYVQTVNVFSRLPINVQEILLAGPSAFRMTYSANAGTNIESLNGGLPAGVDVHKVLIV